MPRQRAIPEHLCAELKRRRDEGAPLRKLILWLAGEGVDTNMMTVSRTLDRINGVKRVNPEPPEAEDPAPPEEPPPPEPADTVEEEEPEPAPTPAVKAKDDPLAYVKHLRRRAHVETRMARDRLDDDPEAWKRYHSAMRLVLMADAAVVRREVHEERPRPGAPVVVTAPGAAPAEAAHEMSQAERDAWVAAAEGPPN